MAHRLSEIISNKGSNNQSSLSSGGYAADLDDFIQLQTPSSEDSHVIDYDDIQQLLEQCLENKQEEWYDNPEFVLKFLM